MTTLPEHDFWERVFSWLTSSGGAWETIAKWAILAVIILSVAAWSLGYFIEKLTKAIETYKSSGLPVTFNRRERAKIRRRQQFCSVLNADLASLAKSENWNDQYFTDLEAEIEAEGEYYSTAISRILRRKSRGLRRASSLINALKSSTEQALLLVGEPGSGKSVALRHLAHQLAQQGLRSADPATKIPLYVNLKELTNLPPEGPTADIIKAFVLENIRRGDADTVAYVKENWDDFKARGLWFFLFDSFDEIPAVLHAATGSPVIRQYAESVRQFLESLGGCRGILASREFKGPDALPWQKFRILSLSEQRQDQLIENSFLDHDQRELVSRHLASSTSSLRNNPMFLTLLCRYVKDEKKAPANDHDLLSGHIERLANREPDYIQRKYRLTPQDLLSGAVQLATLFAESPNLSLAPTLDEISLVWKQNDIQGPPPDEFLAALVDVKILRSDVQEARAGDRRFTFSHRRYQETLFVNYLAKEPSHLTANSLLTDSRWREYTVTLLQSQSREVIRPLLDQAGAILHEIGMAQKAMSIHNELGDGLVFYDWNDKRLAALLGLLQEGLARRLDAIPSELSEAVERVLRPRWETTDLYDRRMVVKFGGLLPQKSLREFLAYSINADSSKLRAAAFSQSVFLVEMTEDLASWVRRRLSDQLLASPKRVDMLRLEALAARLPTSIGAKHTVRRSLLLRKLIAIHSTLIFPPLLLLHLKAHRKLSPRTVHPSVVAALANFVSLIMVFAAAAYTLTNGLTDMAILLWLLAGSAATLGLASLCIDAVRADGRNIPIRRLLLNMAGKISIWTAIVVLFAALAALFAFPDQSSRLLVAHRVPDESGVIITSLLSLALLVPLLEFRRERIFRSRLKKLRITKRGMRLALEAKSLEELSYWLNMDDGFLSAGKDELRSLLRTLGAKPGNAPTYRLFASVWAQNKELLLMVIDKLEEKIDRSIEEESR